MKAQFKYNVVINIHIQEPHIHFDILLELFCVLFYL